MKKNIRQILCILMIITMIGSINMESQAAEIDEPYTSFPARETINADEESFIRIGVGSDGESISNIKSKSKRLIVKLVKISTYKENGGKWYTIEAYSKHEGTYKVGYTYTDENGKQNRKIIRVRVTDESPLKFVKIRGKKLVPDTENTISFKKGKLVVKMKKGYRLKKIELMKYNTLKEGEFGETKFVTSQIKNKSVIDISDTPYHSRKRYANDKKNEISAETISAAAESKLKITYIDKFSKKEKQIIYTIYKRLI